jgi:transcriptional regulator with XRE-family HTH domain
MTMPDSPPADLGRLAAGIGRRRLGARLRELRLAQQMSLDEVAGRLGVAASTISRIETGKAPTRLSYLMLLLDMYGVTDAAQVQQLTSLAREGAAKGWWADYNNLLPPPARQYIGLEAAAASIRAYAPALIPDLLQTSGYAAAAAKATRPGIGRSPASRLAAATMRRQEIMRDGFALHVVIEEAVLRAVVGSAHVMAGQIRQLAALAAEPGVTIQVLVMATPRPVICPPLTVLSFPADPDVACTGNVYALPVLCKQTGIAAARDAFASLARAALPAGESARLIAALPGLIQERDHE